VTKPEAGKASQKGAAVKKKSRTVVRVGQPAARPQARHLPLVDLVVDLRAELLELAVAAGLKVLEAMLEADRDAVCGPRYRHQGGRTASRAGRTPSQVVLGGRKVTIQRPRVRGGGQEVPLPTFTAFADTDPLGRRTVEQMLVGVATRAYARTLEPVGADVRTSGTSKSAVSRRFVAYTRAQLEAWRARPLDQMQLAALFIDGMVFAKHHCVVVALGVDTTGQKHVLGLWDGSTENATVCQDLLSNLQSRGLRTDRSLLVVLDGSRALRKAVDQLFGEAAWVQRCQAHKMRNVLGYLPPGQQAWARAILRRAYRAETAAQGRKLLLELARRLESDYPTAAESVREGLDDTLTVLQLPVGERLRRSLATTNAIESLMSRIRSVHRNVKRWRSRTMPIRWAAAGIVEAARGFKRVWGCNDVRLLVSALRARDEQRGFASKTQAA
jgi:putative transposase